MRQRNTSEYCNRRQGRIKYQVPTSLIKCLLGQSHKQVLPSYRIKKSLRNTGKKNCIAQTLPFPLKSTSKPRRNSQILPEPAPRRLPFNFHIPRLGPRVVSQPKPERVKQQVFYRSAAKENYYTGGSESLLGINLLSRNSLMATSPYQTTDTREVRRELFSNTEINRRISTKQLRTIGDYYNTKEGDDEESPEKIRLKSIYCT